MGAAAPGAPEQHARLNRLAGAVCAALLIAVLVSTFAGSGAAAPGGRLGGDLPAFYGAGSVAADGDWDELYDASRQIAAQADLWEDTGSYLYFAYPPYVAGVYRALVPLGYRGAYLVHTLLMGAALWAAVRLATPLVPWLRRRTLVAFTVALTFYPMLRSVLGGQNAPLTLLLVVAVARLEHDGRAFAAGVAAALLLYKPQFGVPLALLLVAGRRWRMLRGWAAGASVLYATAALTNGLGWVGDWWSQATEFRELNMAANGSNFISIPGVVEHLLGAGSGAAGSIAVVVTVVGGAAAAALWWRRPERPLLRMAVAVAVIVTIAPQSLFYEAGVLFMPVAVLAPQDPTTRARVLGAFWTAGLLHLFAPGAGASPLAVVPVAIAVWAVRTGWGEHHTRLAPV